MLTLTALIVTIALLGAVVPVGADRAESNENDGPFGDLGLDSDTDAEHGEANVSAENDNHDESNVGGFALDGDDETISIDGERSDGDEGNLDVNVGAGNLR